jgi:hypothetical protein
VAYLNHILRGFRWWISSAKIAKEKLLGSNGFVHSTPVSHPAVQEVSANSSCCSYHGRHSNGRQGFSEAVKHRHSVSKGILARRKLAPPFAWPVPEFPEPVLPARVLIEVGLSTLASYPIGHLSHLDPKIKICSIIMASCQRRF